MRYRREIDGLRAIAVLPVILFHGGISSFSGGYVGVDVFFVISGYLITTLIINDLLHDKFSIWEFYERRARRILPALFVVMLACVPFAMNWMIPSQRKDFFESLIAVNLFASNWLFWSEDDYFGLASELKPLLHTWSLAVEEQFYIVFPLFLIFTMRKSRRLPWWPLIGIVLLSFILCVWAVRIQPTSAFYLPVFRVWELGAGALVAFFLIKAPGTRSEIGASFGLFALILSIFVLKPETAFPSEWALLPVLGTCAIILFAQQGTVVARLLSLRPIVFIGLISYSAYLWHQPIFAFAQIKLGVISPILTTGLIATTFIFSILSWRFVEQPVRNIGKRQTPNATHACLASRNGVFITSAIGMGAFMILGKWGNVNDGFSGSFDRVNVAGYDWDNKRLQQHSWALLRVDNGHRNATGDPNDNLAQFTDPARPNFLLIGNSHAKDLYNAFAHNPRLDSDVEIARYGVQMEDLAHSDNIFWTSPNYVAADTVFLSTYYRRNSADLDATADIINRMQADAKQVVVVSNSPTFGGTRAQTRADDALLPFLMSGTDFVYADMVQHINSTFWRALDSTSQHERDAQNERLRDIAADSRAIFLDRLDYLCEADAQRCFAIGIDLSKHFYDRHHTTMAGAAFFGQRMAEIGWLNPVFFE